VVHIYEGLTTRVEYEFDENDFNTARSSVVGEYTLRWLAQGSINYATFISNNFSGVSFTPAGSDAGYITGNDAEAALNAFHNIQQFNGVGSGSGAFEDLLNIRVGGIELPLALRSALEPHKENVPIIGVFQFQVEDGPIPGPGVIAFLITKRNTGGSPDPDDPPQGPPLPPTPF
jgi:hypothetical protein